VEVTRRRSPRLGYALAATAATMWAVNGSLAKLVLDEGVDALHLSQIRATVSFLLLLGFLAAFKREDLKVRRREIPALALLGIGCLAFIQSTYFLAIDRLDVGVALAIQYTGPLLLLLYLRFFKRQPLAPSLWGAVGLSAVGSFFVVQAYDAKGIDGIGIAWAVMAAIGFAFYLVLSENAGKLHKAHTTLTWAFGFTSLFWLVVRPPWTFPLDAFGEPRTVLLALGVAIVGTLIPFVLIVASVRHIPAPRAAVVATLEPVLAAILAWPILDQKLEAPQIAGVCIVVAAVIWVQSHRPAAVEEGGGLPAAAP
jgi:drug/metabolite transporter (DMT)-like permease